MTDYTSTLTLADAAQLIRDTPGRTVIFTHAKPDGDAFGSVVALVVALRAMGKTVDAWFVPPVPDALTNIRGSGLINVYEDNTDFGEADRIVIVDTGAWSQVGPVRSFVEPRLDRTLIIDHHLSGDIPAPHRYIDGEAAACCEILAELVRLLIPEYSAVEPRMLHTLCDALFVGIASDTGWFRFSNTRPETHRLAAEMIAHGVDHAELYRRLEQTERPEKLALLIRALDSLKLLAGGRAAVMVLRRGDFDETGAFEEETERLIDIPQQVATIQAIVLISEKQNNNGEGPAVVTRMSFRSKPQMPGGPEPVNVAELAGQFGGGGHARAAGATVEAPIDEVLPKVCAALEAAIAGD